MGSRWNSLLTFGGFGGALSHTGRHQALPGRTGPYWEPLSPQLDPARPYTYVPPPAPPIAPPYAQACRLRRGGARGPPQGEEGEELELWDPGVGTPLGGQGAPREEPSVRGAACEGEGAEGEGAACEGEGAEGEGAEGQEADQGDSESKSGARDGTRSAGRGSRERGREAEWAGGSKKIRAGGRMETAEDALDGQQT